MATLNFNKALTSGGLSGLRTGSDLPASFIGPVRPGQTIGGVSPLMGAGSVLGANTSAGRISGGAPVSAVPMPDFSGAANANSSAELASLNTMSDQSRADLEAQLGSLGNQKANTLSSLGTQLEGVRTQVGKSRLDAQESTDKNIQDALTTAQDVERSNRNKLRALGILNSSAGGDILSRPLQEYDKQRGALSQALTKRVAELDDFLNQKTAEHADAVRQVESQYVDLVGRIQSDLRFNERQRGDAIKSANAALQQRLADIQQAQFNYAAQVNALKGSYAQGMTGIASYQQPTYDKQALTAQNYQVAPTNPNVYQPGIVQSEEQRKKLSGLSL